MMVINIGCGFVDGVEVELVISERSCVFFRLVDEVNGFAWVLWFWE